MDNTHQDVTEALACGCCEHISIGHGLPKRAVQDLVDDFLVGCDSEKGLKWEPQTGNPKNIVPLIQTLNPKP